MALFLASDQMGLFEKQCAGIKLIQRACRSHFLLALSWQCKHGLVT